jgi:hypothetical protein
MRVYARSRNADGTKSWVVVETAINGDNSMVSLVALCQVLLLNKNESPFFGSFGIAARQAVQQQVAPDYDITRIQNQYAQYFASLIIAKASSNPPVYNISVITLYGARLAFALPVNASPPNQIPQ